jgi:hypothetical protein
MNDILDNNLDFQSVLNNAPQLPESDGPENSKKSNIGGILLKIVLTLGGIYILNIMIKKSTNRIIANIKKGGDNPNELTE